LLQSQQQSEDERYSQGDAAVFSKYHELDRQHTFDLLNYLLKLSPCHYPKPRYKCNFRDQQIEVKKNPYSFSLTWEKGLGDKGFS